MTKQKRRWNRVTTINSFKSLKTVRVFGIARVSTDKQAKYGESLEHQKEVLFNWVRTKSSINAPQEWIVAEIYIENEDRDGNKRGRSATTREGRQGLAKAIQLAKAGSIDVVVATKLDRIARDVRDYVDISAELNESGVALVCLDLDIDTSTPDGQMIMRNHANLAQWQAERIAQYSIETARRHVHQGRPLGLPPLGYKIAKDSNGKGTFAFDQSHRKHVDLIEKLYLRYRSIDRVVLELHKKGFKSPRNKTYSKPQVNRILRNIKYTGFQEYDEKVYEGNWPAMRTKETQERILSILVKNRASNRSPNRVSQSYTYLFQGILKCHRCHSSMMPRPSNGRGNKSYPYYVCVKADKTGGIDCEYIYLPAEATDKAIVDFVRKLSIEPETIQDTIQRANRATSTRIDSLENDLSRVREQLKDIRSKITNIVDVLADQGVSRLEGLKNKLTVLDQDEKETVIQEKRLEQELQSERVQAGSALEQIQTLSLFNDLFLMNEGQPERIKTILPRFVNYVICHMADKKRGIGRLDVGLFGRPFNGGPNAEIWNEALSELAERCNENLSVNKVKSSVDGKDCTANSHIHEAMVSGKQMSPCGTEGNCFAVREQMG